MAEIVRCTMEPGLYVRPSKQQGVERHLAIVVFTTIDGRSWWRYAGESTAYPLRESIPEAVLVGPPDLPPGVEYIGKPLTMSEIQKYLSLNPELKSQLNIAIGALGKICTATTDAFKDLPHSGAKEMVAKLTQLLT